MLELYFNDGKGGSKQEANVENIEALEKKAKEYLVGENITQCDIEKSIGSCEQKVGTAQLKSDEDEIELNFIFLTPSQERIFDEIVYFFSLKILDPLEFREEIEDKFNNINFD